MWGLQYANRGKYVIEETDIAKIYQWSKDSFLTCQKKKSKQIEKAFKIWTSSVKKKFFLRQTDEFWIWFIIGIANRGLHKPYMGPNIANIHERHAFKPHREKL